MKWQLSVWLSLICSACVSSYVPRAKQQTLGCHSNNYRYASCRAKGPIATVKVLKRLSDSPCVLNKSYGFNGSLLWVDKGCRANFMVVISSVMKANIGHPSVYRNQVDTGASGLFSVAVSSHSGTMERWSAYIANPGTLTLLVLRKKSTPGDEYVIRYSHSVDFDSKSLHRSHTRSCQNCPYIERGDMVAFSYTSDEGGMVRFSVSDSCKSGEYAYYSPDSNRNHTTGTVRTMVPMTTASKCRTYSLIVAINTNIYIMQDLSNGRISDISQAAVITSHRGPVFVARRKSILRITAPDNNGRIRLKFNGPVHLSAAWQRVSIASVCTEGLRNRLALYEYVSGIRKHLLPTICGNWDENRYRIPVLPVVVSQTSQVYVEFDTHGIQDSVSDGFNMEFNVLNKSPETIYLSGRCALTQSLDKRKTEVQSFASNRHFPASGTLSRYNADAANMDCSVRLIGVSRKESFTIIFTWVQLSTINKCDRFSPYISVLRATKRKKKKEYHFKELARVCGQRTPFVLETNSYDIQIRIKGDLGYGLAFDVYTSREAARLNYRYQTTGENEGSNQWYIGVIVFFSFIVVCSIHQALRNPQSFCYKVKQRVTSAGVRPANGNACRASTNRQQAAPRRQATPSQQANPSQTESSTQTAAQSPLPSSTASRDGTSEKNSSDPPSYEMAAENRLPYVTILPMNLPEYSLEPTINPASVPARAMLYQVRGSVSLTPTGSDLPPPPSYREAIEYSPGGI